MMMFEHLFIHGSYGMNGFNLTIVIIGGLCVLYIIYKLLKLVGIFSGVFDLIQDFIADHITHTSGEPRHKSKKRLIRKENQL